VTLAPDISSLRDPVGAGLGLLGPPSLCLDYPVDVAGMRSIEYRTCSASTSSFDHRGTTSIYAPYMWRPARERKREKLMKGRLLVSVAEVALAAGT